MGTTWWHRIGVAALGAWAIGSTATASPSNTGPDFSPRFRWGISGGGGPALGAYSGGVGVIDARFGVQLSEFFGVYGQPAVLFGGALEADVSGATSTGFGFFGLGALAEVDPVDFFYLAAGPELVSGGFASTSAGESGGSVSADVGAYFGVTTRAGFALGTMSATRRSAFTIGVDAHFVFLPGGTFIAPMVALGYDAF